MAKESVDFSEQRNASVKEDPYIQEQSDQKNLETVLAELSLNSDPEKVVQLMYRIKELSNNIDLQNQEIKNRIVSVMKQLKNVYDNDDYLKKTMISQSLSIILENIHKRWTIRLDESIGIILNTIQTMGIDRVNHEWKEFAKIWMTLDGMKKLDNIWENLKDKQIIVIGVSVHKNNAVKNLQWTTNDVKNVRDMLLRIGTSPNNITELTGDSTTKDNILDAIRTKSANSPNGILIYFAGHGTGWADVIDSDKDSWYILPYDTEGVLWKWLSKNTLISAQDLISALWKNSIPPVVILDSCEWGYIGSELSKWWVNVIVATDTNNAWDRLSLLNDQKRNARLIDASVANSKELNDILHTKDGWVFTTKLIQNLEKSWSLWPAFMDTSRFLQNITSQSPAYFHHWNGEGIKIRKIKYEK